MVRFFLLFRYFFYIINDMEKQKFDKIRKFFTLDSFNKFVHSKWFIYSFSFVSAFLILMICSGDSFLYAFNSWCDLNMYMTMGNGVLNGKIMYQQIFDHKGPLVYFIFAIFNIFPKPYVACYVFESICMGFFIIITYKIAKKWIENDFLSLSAAIIVSYVTSVCDFFGLGGGAVEQFCLPIFAYFVLFLLDVFEGEKISNKKALLLGLFVSICFWVKYTFVILTGLILLIWFVFNLIKKDYKNTFINIGFMAIGFVAISVPILLYFLVNGAIGDLWTVYFYNNIFLYQKQDLFQSNLKSVADNYIIFIFIIIGIMPIVMKYKSKSLIYSGLLLIYFMSLFFMKGYGYYFLPLMVFLTFGVIAVFIFMKENLAKFNTVAAVVVTLLSTVMLSIHYSNVLVFLGREVETYVQYEIAQDINNSKIEDPSLFIYKIKDIGFYNVANIVPDEKYFAHVNFDEKTLPEMWESFTTAISEKRNNFVVTSTSIYNKEKSFLLQHYNHFKSYSGYVLLIRK